VEGNGRIRCARRPSLYENKLQDVYVRKEKDDGPERSTAKRTGDTLLILRHTIACQSPAHLHAYMCRDCGNIPVQESGLKGRIVLCRRSTLALALTW
jgi:hypothetical protein